MQNDRKVLALINEKWGNAKINEQLQSGTFKQGMQNITVQIILLNNLFVPFYCCPRRKLIFKEDCKI